MNVLITGSKGFIGQNLIYLLEKNNSNKILEYEKKNTFEELHEYCKDADAVFHLAAVLRPENLSGFDENIDLTSRLLNNLKEAGNTCPVMFASSIQSDLDNPYGQCKRIEENKIIEYGKKNNVNTYIFRFPNLFGTMSRPNYTSVIATFCYNTVHGIPITINEPSAHIKFVFIESVLEQVISIVMENRCNSANKITNIDKYYLVGLGELAYYMETLKREDTPAIMRNDDFYDRLKYTYQWYLKNPEYFI